MAAPVRDIDRGAAALINRLKRFARGGGYTITVGVHSLDGEAPKKGDASGALVIDVAAAHEFGLGVPRRSFIADWQDENVALHKKQVEAMAKAILDGKVASADVAAARLANLWVGDIQKRIRAGIAPPLSPATIARKKSSTPLIDTGQLWSSIAYAINGKLTASKAFETAVREREKSVKKTAAQAKKQAQRERAKAVKALKTRAKKQIASATRQLSKAAKSAKRTLTKKTKRFLKDPLKKIRPKKKSSRKKR